MDIDIRPITREEGDQFSAVLATAFGETFTDEELADHDRWFEYDRSIGAFDGDRIVGTGGAFSMDRESRRASRDSARRRERNAPALSR